MKQAVQLQFTKITRMTNYDSQNIEHEIVNTKEDAQFICEEFETNIETVFECLKLIEAKDFKSSLSVPHLSFDYKEVEISGIKNLEKLDLGLFLCNGSRKMTISNCPDLRCLEFNTVHVEGTTITLNIKSCPLLTSLVTNKYQEIVLSKIRDCPNLKYIYGGNFYKINKNALNDCEGLTVAVVKRQYGHVNAPPGTLIAQNDFSKCKNFLGFFGDYYFDFISSNRPNPSQKISDIVLDDEVPKEIILYFYEDTKEHGAKYLTNPQLKTLYQRYKFLEAQNTALNNL